MRPNLFGILGICYVVFMFSVTIGFVGQPSCVKSGVYSAELPFQMLVFTIIPFVLGYLGRSDKD